ncbi:ComEC/Rec2 family competence protein [Neorhizobium sp. NPDC001467]|uniref:ComEC/Rec2 family competence protein n=1 Tax=Neorhizobium sp. NPDC001467 TaxID=3390595 RepID=UPI003D074669
MVDIASIHAPLDTPRGVRSSRTLTSNLLALCTRTRIAVLAMLVEEQAHGRIFLLLPVLIGTGAILWLTAPTEPPLAIVIGAFCCSLVISLALRSQTSLLRYVAPAAALVLSGMSLAAFEDWRRATVVLDQPVTTVVTGVVEMREASVNGRWRYVLAVEATTTPTLRRQPERVVVLSRLPEPVFRIGDRISGRARLSPPSGPALPGLADFAFAGYFDGVGAIGFFYGAPALVGGKVEPTWAQMLERTVFTWRSTIADRIRQTVPGDAGAFAAAIVTDERRAISAETTEALRLSGLAHIVAISGLNMALAAGIFFVGLRSLFGLMPAFAQAFPVKKLAAAAALVMATGYYLISGFGVSAERAYIMMAIMLIAVFFDRPAISMRNVALSALIVLALSPSEILGPSFQMSFAATVALVAGYSAWSRGRADDDDPPWRPAALKPVFAVGSLFAGVFVTSLIGALSTAIFSIDHFHRVATYGLAANLAAMPFVSFVVMPFGLIAMLLMPVGLDGPFLQVMGTGLDGVIIIAKTVAGWGGDVSVGRQPAAFLPVATLGFLVLTLPRTRLSVIGLPVVAAALLLSWQARREPAPDLLVSEDASLVAILNAGEVAASRTRPPNFIYAQWKHALSLPQATPPTLLDVSEPGASKAVAIQSRAFEPRPQRPTDVRKAPAQEATPGTKTTNAVSVASTAMLTGGNEPGLSVTLTDGEAGNREATGTEGAPVTVDVVGTGAEADIASKPIVGTKSVMAPKPSAGAKAEVTPTATGEVKDQFGVSATPKAPATRRPPLTPEEITRARQSMQKALATGANAFTCAGRSWCVAHPPNGPTIAVVEDARFAGAACDVAQVVIAARARYPRCRSGAMMINGEALRRTGALEIRFNRSADPRGWSVAAAKAGAARSWDRHRHYDWRRNLYDAGLQEPLRSLVGATDFNDSGE